MGGNFKNFKGLVPGTMSNVNDLNPFAIFGAFMTGSTPPCREISLETIDTNNRKNNETHHVSDYDIKNLDNVKEVGLGLGLGIEFGLYRNQIDFGYNIVNRDNIYTIGSETVQSFNVGVSIGDLWFVKRRKI